MRRSSLTLCEECPLFQRHGTNVPLFKGGKRAGETEYAEVPYRGSRSAQVMIVGESPGAYEIFHKKPFVGPSGELSEQILSEVGIPQDSVFYANACRCMIPKKEVREKEIAAALRCCRPALVRAIEMIRPKLLICYGDIALRQVLKQRGITGKRGQFKYSKEFQCWVLPTFHPSYCLRDQKQLAFFRPDLFQAARFLRDELKPSEEETIDTVCAETLQDILEKTNIAVSLDTETQGLDWTDPESLVIGYSVSDDEGGGRYIPLFREAHPGEAEDIVLRDGKRVVKLPDFQRKIKELRELCERADLVKVMMNGNYDLHRLIQLGIHEVRNYRMDIQTAFHCLDPDLHKGRSLGDIQRVLTPEVEDYKQLFSESFDKSDMLRVARDAPEALSAYAARDAAVTLRCAKRIARELKKLPFLENYYVKCVHPVTTEVLFPIERNGIAFDTESLVEAKETLAAELVELHRKFLSLVPKKVLLLHEDKGKRGQSGCVLTRAAFLRDVFFSKLGFGIKPLKMTDTGKVSTDRKMFTELLDMLDPDSDAARAASVLLEWGPIHKLYTTYIKGFEDAVKPDGRLHTQITKVMTSTGRTSSRSPNLQNIPKRNKKIASAIRRLLVAPPGKMLVAADYSQQELRWIAHRSMDPEFLRVYREGGDIHAKTALALLGVKSKEDVPKDVFDTARRNAKSCNFGFVYGMQAKKFRRYAFDEYKLNLTEEEAEQWRKDFFSLYRGLLAWHEREIAFARKHGYCVSPFGFCRRLPNIRSENIEIRSQEERYAINTPIQNAGSDSTLLAALQAIREGLVDGIRARIVLFIHDELIFEVDEDHVPIFVPKLRQVMEGMDAIFKRDFHFEMAVPLETDIEIGINLAEMHPFDMKGEEESEGQTNAIQALG